MIFVFFFDNIAKIPSRRRKIKFPYFILIIHYNQHRDKMSGNRQTQKSWGPPPTKRLRLCHVDISTVMGALFRKPCRRKRRLYISHRDVEDGPTPVKRRCLSENESAPECVDAGIRNPNRYVTTSCTVCPHCKKTFDAKSPLFLTSREMGFAESQNNSTTPPSSRQNTFDTLDGIPLPVTESSNEMRKCESRISVPHVDFLKKHLEEIRRSLNECERLCNKYTVARAPRWGRSKEGNPLNHQNQESKHNLENEIFVDEKFRSSSVTKDRSLKWGRTLTDAENSPCTKASEAHGMGYSPVERQAGERHFRSSQNQQSDQDSMDHTSEAGASEVFTDYSKEGECAKNNFDGTPREYRPKLDPCGTIHTHSGIPNLHLQASENTQGATANHKEAQEREHSQLFENTLNTERGMECGANDFIGARDLLREEQFDNVQHVSPAINATHADYIRRRRPRTNNGWFASHLEHYPFCLTNFKSDSSESDEES